MQIATQHNDSLGRPKEYIYLHEKDVYEIIYRSQKKRA